MRALSPIDVCPNACCSRIPFRAMRLVIPLSLQIVTATLVVISFVCMQLDWSAPWPAFESFDRWQRIQALLKPHRVMPVCCTDQHNQRNAASVYNNMALAAELASVCRVGACLLAPRGLGLTSHQCWPEPNRSDRLDEDVPALPCAGAARLLQLATAADVSNTSCRCRGQAIAAGPPKEYLSAEHKEFLGMHPHR